MSIDDYEKAKAEKKAAIAAMMKKGESEAKPVDEFLRLASMTLAAKVDAVNEFALANGGAKAKRERERKAKEAAKLVDSASSPHPGRRLRPRAWRPRRSRRPRRQAPAVAAAAAAATARPAPRASLAFGEDRRPRRRRSRRLRPQRQDRGTDPPNPPSAEEFDAARDRRVKCRQTDAARCRPDRRRRRDARRRRRRIRLGLRSNGTPHPNTRCARRRPSIINTEPPQKCQKKKQEKENGRPRGVCVGGGVVGASAGMGGAGRRLENRAHPRRLF